MPDRLKLNVFTPLPPSPTDIANVNLPIITLLQDAADVTVWTPQEYWDPLEDKRIEVKTFRADAIAFWDLNDADANIFHIGNNREMHEDIFDIARRIPGLIVLHDVNLHEFSLEMYHAKRIATYEEILRRCHGERALNEARHALAHGGMDAVLRRYPCSLAPAAHATGILMHNAKAAADLRRQTTIPVFDLPLPFADLVWPDSIATATSSFGHLALLWCVAAPAKLAVLVVLATGWRVLRPLPSARLALVLSGAAILLVLAGRIAS